MGRGEKLQIVSEPEAAAVYSLDAMDPSFSPSPNDWTFADHSVDMISRSEIPSCSVMLEEEQST